MFNKYFWLSPQNARKRLCRVLLPVCALITALAVVFFVWILPALKENTPSRSGEEQQLPADLIAETVPEETETGAGEQTDPEAEPAGYEQATEGDALPEETPATQEGPAPAPQATEEPMGDSAPDPLEEMYAEAITLKDRGEYIAAAEAFEALEQYQESAALAAECRTLQAEKEAEALRATQYANAVTLKEQGEYIAAAEAFEALEQYQESAALAAECRALQAEKEAEALRAARYADAVTLKEQGEYIAAAEAFEALEQYQESAALAAECRALQAEKEAEALRAAQYADALSLKEQGEYLAAAEAFEALEQYQESAALAAECRALQAEKEAEALRAARYADAVTLKDQGEYIAAAEAFEALEQYQESVALAEACRTLQAEKEAEALRAAQYEDALSLKEQGEYIAAAEAFEALEQYQESAALAAECRALQAEKEAEEARAEQYAKAQAQKETGRFIEAEAAFRELQGYLDSEAQADACASLQAEREVQQARAAALAREEACYRRFTTPGSVITFGHYEQDGLLETDSEPIEWIVLAHNAEGNQSLLISRYVLDQRCYNRSLKKVAWSDCTLRTWLNEEFLPSAFTADEQQCIIYQTVNNDRTEGNPQWTRTADGIKTMDKVFLLSYAQVQAYFPTEELRMAQPTAYAVQRGVAAKAGPEGGGACRWWLRSPGAHWDDAAYVSTAGAIGGGLYAAVYDAKNTIGVRPAIWVDVSRMPLP